MSISLKIPTPLRRMTNGESSATVDGANIIECIDSLDSLHPGIKDRLVADNGELHRFVNVYVNGEDIRFKDGIKTAVNSGDEVSIVPAVAGG